MFEVKRSRSMLGSFLKCTGAVLLLASAFMFGQEPARQSAPRTVLFEVLRTSWDAQRNETLVYLRVYADGFAEAHPMRKVDLRSIEFEKRQLTSNELATLRSLLNDPGTTQLKPEYSGYWGNKDFGFRYDVTIFGPSSDQHISLVNFQPFLALKEGKPYPQQVEKLGCSIWRLRAEVSGEPLEKDWLAGCTGLGF
jgi:hypothetical protein